MPTAATLTAAAQPLGLGVSGAPRSTRLFADDDASAPDSSESYGARAPGDGAGTITPANSTPPGGTAPASPSSGVGAGSGGAGSGGAGSSASGSSAGGSSATADATFAALGLDALASLVLNSVDDELPSSPVYDTDTTPD